MRTLLFCLLTFLFMTVDCIVLAQDGWILYHRTQDYSYSDIACSDSDNCIIIGSDYRNYAAILRTTSGGESWTRTYTGPTRSNTGDLFRLVDADYPSLRLCVSVGDSGTVIRSTDQGKSWARHVVQTPNRLLSVDMADTLNGVVSTFNEIWKTTDGGVTWQLLSIPSFPFVNSVACPTSDTIIARLGTTSAEQAARSINGGQTWAIGHEFDRDVRDFFFVDGLYGWSCGGKRTVTGDQESDIIYHTSDGGMTWINQLDQLIESPYGLQSIQFFDRLNGIAVGSAGKILRTVNGGKRWIPESSGLSSDNLVMLTSVAYAAKYRAYTVATTGHFLRKGDGFHNWASVVVEGTEHKDSILGIVVAPNPVSLTEPLKVQLTGNQNSSVSLSIINLLGEQTGPDFTFTLRSGEHNIQLPTTSLGIGIYFLRVVSERETRIIVFLIR